VRRYAGLEPASLIDEAVDGDGLPALTFVSKSGIITYLDSNYRAAAPYNSPRFTFGAGVGEIPFEAAQPDDSDSFLYNDIRASKEDGTTLSAEDATSISRFGQQTLPLDGLPIDSDADLQSYVDALLAKYKDPLVRIPSFTVNGGTAERRNALLSLDLGDCVRVKLQPPGAGGPIDQTSYIERRHIWQSSPSDVIRAEFSISPR
jgi:hypothetical protein